VQDFEPISFECTHTYLWQGPKIVTCLPTYPNNMDECIESDVEDGTVHPSHISCEYDNFFWWTQSTDIHYIHTWGRQWAQGIWTQIEYQNEKVPVLNKETKRWDDTWNVNDMTAVSLGWAVSKCGGSEKTGFAVFYAYSLSHENH